MKKALLLLGLALILGLLPACAEEKAAETSPEQSSEAAGKSAATPADESGEAGSSTATDSPDQVDSPTRLSGVDVSSFQGTINWGGVRQAGISFAYARATEGVTFVDQEFARNWAGMQEAGIPRGAYHFFRVGDPGAAQASNFLQQFTLSPGDLLPMVDLEQGSIPEGVRLNPQAMQDEIFTFLKAVETGCGCRPIIYTDPSFANQYLKDERFATYKLWVAEYDVNAPRIPDVWGNASWTIWQYADNGTVAGIPANVDMDYYHGDLSEMKQELFCNLD